jgi:hypothetical protein
MTSYISPFSVNSAKESIKWGLDATDDGFDQINRALKTSLRKSLIPEQLFRLSDH